MRLAWHAAATVLLALGISSAGSSHARADTSPTPDAADQITNSLLAAMKAQNYAAAYGMFDDKMKAAVSEERLRAAWSAQLSTLGPMVSYAITQRKQAQGLDVRMASLKFDHGELQATVAVHPDTKEVAGFGVRPAPSSAKPAPPAPYVHPSDFHSVEISAGTAPYVLGATLTVPVGLGPFPGVVLVHGSGPQDRDETVAANKVFKDLAEGLASRGIEVLRYDKRTFVYGAKLGDSVTVDQEVVLDAIAAVGALRDRQEIDPKRIFVIGHSMGALLAPEIGVRSAPVAGVVLMAPPGRPIWDMVVSQMKYLGSPASETAETEQKLAKLKAGTLGSDRFLGVPTAYWKDLGARDGFGMAKKLGKPILVLHGDRDYQVIEEDIEAWRKTLAGTPHVEFATLTGLNHLFIAGTGKPGPAEYDRPGHVDAKAVEKMVAFIKQGKAE